MTENTRAILSVLKYTGAYQTGDFTLASGAKSDTYLDCRLVTMHSIGLQTVIEQMRQLLTAKGDRVLVVDDVATSGGSLIQTIGAVRDAGADPVAAMVIVDREQGAKYALEGLGVPLYSLITLDEVKKLITP